MTGYEAAIIAEAMRRLAAGQPIIASGPDLAALKEAFPDVEPDEQMRERLAAIIDPILDDAEDPLPS